MTSRETLRGAPRTGRGHVLVGVDFRQASASWRAALHLTADERAQLAEALSRAAGAVGFVALETCNRTEWIADSPKPEWTGELLRGWILRRWREQGFAGPFPEPRMHVDEAALLHVLRVAVGLESLVPGEREIAGQCRRAFALARLEGTSSPGLADLAHAAARAVRRVERLSDFRDAGRGVHTLAADLLLGRLGSAGLPPGERTWRIAVAGVGEIGRRVCETLTQRGTAQVTTFNRTLCPGTAAGPRPLSELAEALARFDAVVLATSSHEPVLRARDLSPRPERRPLLVLDLGARPQSERSETDPRVLTLDLDDLVHSAMPGARTTGARELAEDIVRLALDEHVAAGRRRSASHLLEAASTMRGQTLDARLPALLDSHAAALPASDRRRLEAALRELLGEHHQGLVHLATEGTALPQLAQSSPDGSPA